MSLILYSNPTEHVAYIVNSDRELEFRAQYRRQTNEFRGYDIKKFRNYQDLQCHITYRLGACTVTTSFGIN